MDKEFKTKDGEQSVQAHDGDWLQPTVNPFGHGCCDCGLFHQVEYRVVDNEGIVQDLEGFHLQLRFTREETETARLREHRRAAVVREGLPPTSLKELKELWQKQDEEKEGR